MDTHARPKASHMLLQTPKTFHPPSSIQEHRLTLQATQTDICVSPTLQVLPAPRCQDPPSLLASSVNHPSSGLGLGCVLKAVRTFQDPKSQAEVQLVYAEAHPTGQTGVSLKDGAGRYGWCLKGTLEHLFPDSGSSGKTKRKPYHQQGHTLYR